MTARQCPENAHETPLGGPAPPFTNGSYGRRRRSDYPSTNGANGSRQVEGRHWAGQQVPEPMGLASRAAGTGASPGPPRRLHLHIHLPLSVSGQICPRHTRKWAWSPGPIEAARTRRPTWCGIVAKEPEPAAQAKAFPSLAPAGSRAKSLGNRARCGGVSRPLVSTHLFRTEDILRKGFMTPIPFFPGFFVLRRQ